MFIVFGPNSNLRRRKTDIYLIQTRRPRDFGYQLDGISSNKILCVWPSPSSEFIEHVLFPTVLSGGGGGGGLCRNR